MCHVLSSSISNREPWTLFEVDPLVACSAPTTSSLAKTVRVTTGRKDVSLIHLLDTLRCLFLRTDYTEGAELVEAVLDVVRKEAEGTDCLQGELIFVL